MGIHLLAFLSVSGFSPFATPFSLILAFFSLHFSITFNLFRHCLWLCRRSSCSPLLFLAITSTAHHHSICLQPPLWCQLGLVFCNWICLLIWDWLVYCWEPVIILCFWELDCRIELCLGACCWSGIVCNLKWLCWGCCLSAQQVFGDLLL